MPDDIAILWVGNYMRSRWRSENGDIVNCYRSYESLVYTKALETEGITPSASCLGRPKEAWVQR
jgi:hypothetical protein